MVSSKDIGGAVNSVSPFLLTTARKGDIIIVWKEEEHPRDNDGKFTDGNGSKLGKVKDALDRAGMNGPTGRFGSILPGKGGPVKEKTNVVLNNDECEVIKAIRNGKSLTEEEMCSAISGISKMFSIPQNRRSGIEDKCLKYILSLKGYDKKPKALSPSRPEKIYEVILKSHMIYRGVSSRKYAEQFYNGDMWVGQGIFGNGVYVSLDEGEAAGYMLHRAEKEESSDATMIKAFLPVNAKIATLKTKEEFRQFQKNWENKNIYRFKNAKSNEDAAQYENEKNFVSDFGKYCALKGYDAYVSREGKDLVILNRGCLYYVKK